MSDVIRLLPDAVANQIAAGEVVQRPASAVKELLENAVDAGAERIHLLIKNAGKTLIQVIDDGEGMSETDARLSLERHATSKIKKVEDLFSLKTMGFRGEAVPSIAAVAQVEIRTKKASKEIGTQLIVEGSKVISQEAFACPDGTNILVKNLFFNIPARRNFLKSNPVESRHIIDEFMRIALIHPEIAMQFSTDGNEMYNLPKSNFRKRIVNIFGKKYNERLVPVSEHTDIVKITGFIGKAEFARKTRGEQFFFVNHRFIKSPYLNHAVMLAYEELIPKDQFPAYFLQLEINPEKIDINIHPTKTEIKFEEERAIYTIVRTAVREALGKFNVAPSIDFDQDNNLTVLPLKANETVKIPNIQVDPNFNPFVQEGKQPSRNTNAHKSTPSNQDWEKLFLASNSEKETTQFDFKQSNEGEKEHVSISPKLMQVHKKYILCQIKSGFLLIDQKAAHQRILIDEWLNREQRTYPSQQLLMPEILNFSGAEFIVLKEIHGDLQKFGFDIRFEDNKCRVFGVPMEMTTQSVQKVLEHLIEDYKNSDTDLQNRQQIKLITALARNMSIKWGQSLNLSEMQEIVDRLFACEMPYALPNGKKTLISYELEEIDQLF